MQLNEAIHIADSAAFNGDSECGSPDLYKFVQSERIDSESQKQSILRYLAFEFLDARQAYRNGLGVFWRQWSRDLRGLMGFIESVPIGERIPEEI